MRNVATMTKEEVAAALAVTLDACEQQVRLAVPNHPQAWMLDFVFDSERRKELEQRARELALCADVAQTSHAGTPLSPPPA